MTKTTQILSFMVVATALGAACYNTKNIQSGGLKCAPSADPSKLGECPDGFFCGEGHLCYRNGSEEMKLCLANEAQPPFGPFASCAPPNQSISLCDPVCQNGCACSHRCQMGGSLKDGYVFECQAPPAGELLDTFKACDFKNDLCKPGRVCLQPVDNSTGCVAQCFRYCRQDADCAEIPGSRCLFTIDVGDGQNNTLICSPPAMPCNPVQQGPAPACANSSTGNACYVFSTKSPDETMCDCAGTIKAGAACQDAHSCIPGYECVGGLCQKLCALAAGGAGCAAGQSCVAYSGSSRFGTCQ